MSTGSEHRQGSSNQLHASTHASSGHPPASRAPASTLSGPADASPLAAPAQAPLSESDIISPDHVLFRPTVKINTNNTQTPHSLPVSPHNTRSPSLPFIIMGQAFSKNPSASSAPPPPPSSPSTALRGLNAAITGGSKLKRAFAGRYNKKSDEPKKMDRAQSRDGLLFQQQQQHRQQRIEATASSSSSPAQLTNQVFNIPEKMAAKSPLYSQTPPPLPSKADLPKTHLRPPPVYTGPDNRSSIIPMSPGISSAVNYMRMGDEQRESELRQERERERKRTANPNKEIDIPAKHLEIVEKAGDGDQSDISAKTDLKDSWRKSDSTIGHHTIRPGASSRPSRPVSMAESLQSTHTIVPVSKRLSALITDADFGMPEEDDPHTEHEDRYKNISTEDKITALMVKGESPTPSVKTKNRRSMSLNLVPAAPFKQKLLPTPASASVADFKQLPQPTPPSSMSQSLSREAPKLTRTAANATGLIGPSSVGLQPTGNKIQGNLAAWSATTTSRSFSGHSNHGANGNPYTTFPPPPEPQRIASNGRDRRLPALPHASSNNLRVPPVQLGPTFRQTAISMTSGFAPAAGLAKRAVEKMGRAWGGLSSSSSNSNVSGYSSSSSANTGTPPSSYSGGHHRSHAHGDNNTNELTRTASNQSSTGGIHHTEKDRRGKLRRTPNAPSTSSSFATSTTSSASISDSDAFATPSGPMLGKRLRGPLRVKHGGDGSGGVVFGRDLRTVVRETGVGVGKPKGWGGRWRNWDDDEEGESAAADAAELIKTRRLSARRGQLKALEDRRLPALVVRCAQHLLIWGVQEEGLFRVSGRPSHVTKLRTEFDTGADFDMAECTPGDLDPHAVASVFKAYLRELPEPILTHALLPLFEAAMNQENALNAVEPVASEFRGSARGPGLPSSPRNSVLPVMRKPPSLSTLAIPSFNGIRPPSKSLLNVFQSLIEQLPEENRDLIRTVTELIMTTATEHKQTKMPLSNLLLVFCPSLNMTPPLLKVLCENSGIWEPEVLDIRNEINLVSDIEAEYGAEEAEEEFSDARDGTEVDGEGESLLSTSRTSEDTPRSVEYHASSEDVQSIVKAENRGDPTSAMYMDSDSICADDTSLMSQPTNRSFHTRAGSSLRDDGSSYTSEDQDISGPHYSDRHSLSMSPPLLTSSAESLDTPPSSGHPSLADLPIPAGNGTDKRKAFAPLQHRGVTGPVIAESSPMGLSPPMPRRPVISNPIPITIPVQFPSSASDTAHASSSSTTLEKRRSIPILSLPSFSPNKFSSFSCDGSNPPRTPDSIRAKRLKKPSLHLLFTKKSSSSLSSGIRVVSSPSSRPTISGPYLQTPRSASDSSVSTPLSAVTAPQSSTITLPPKLETPIDSSSLRFGLGIDISDSPPRSSKVNSRSSADSPRSQPVPSAESPATSMSQLTRGQTPIANLYHREISPGLEQAPASKSSISLLLPSEAQAVTVTSHLRPYLTRNRGTSVSSTASSNHLGLLDDEGNEEDWTKSVLLAADIDVVGS